MRLALLFIATMLCANIFAQRLEMPSPEAVAKNKYTHMTLSFPEDTGHIDYAWYRFDKKGRIVYEKISHPADQGSYYTVYTFDNKGRKATAVDRFDDGRFKQRIEFVWLKDSMHIERIFGFIQDSTSLMIENWLTPHNVAHRVIIYNQDGEKRLERRNIFDTKGNPIGLYDSSAETRTANEYTFYKSRRMKKYNEQGKLLQIITMQVDSSGYITSLTDSSAENKMVQHYTLTQGNDYVVFKNGVRLTETELSIWRSTYGQYYPGVAIGQSQPIRPMEDCYSHKKSYDASGLITSDIIDNMCMPRISFFPYTVVYTYGR